MNFNLLKILAIIIVSLFLLYIINNSLQETSIIEGLTKMPSKVSKQDANIANLETLSNLLENKVTSIKKNLLTSEKISIYENIITNLDELFSLSMLEMSKDISNAGPGSKVDMLTSLQKLNTLNDAKKSLNELMSYLQENIESQPEASTEVQTTNNVNSFLTL